MSTVTRTYAGVSAEERVAARRERLLDAGLELFGTQGVEATRVKDLCREAGLTDRYFYESFTGAGELFVAVFDRVCDRLFTAVGEAVVAAPAEPEAQLRAAVGTFLELLASDARLPRVVFAEAPVAGAQAEAHMRETLRRFATLVSATARPHLPSDLDPALLDLVGQALVGTLERVVVDWQDERLPDALADVAECVVALQLATLRGLGWTDDQPPS